MPLIDDVRQTALSLSVSERAALAHDLLVSLDDVEEADANELDEQWTAEILRRSDTYHQGLAQATDWEESLARVRAAFRKNRQS